MVRECTVHLRHSGVRSAQHVAKTAHNSLVRVPALRPRLPPLAEPPHVDGRVNMLQTRSP